VRAVVSPSTVGRSRPLDGLECIRADLRTAGNLQRACTGVGVVVHLAAKLRGDDALMISTAADGTRRLLDAMVATGVPRLVLASSLSVYDWSAAGPVLNEETALEPRPEFRDAYTTAKLLQERIARARCAQSGIQLAVLRPGVIWGPGREYAPTIGQRLGPFHVLVAPGRQLPIVHVDNCADAFAVAADVRKEGTFNVVDHPDVTVRQFVTDHLRRSRRFGLAIPAAYRPFLAVLTLIHRFVPDAMKAMFPGFAGPARFAARYKPVRIDGDRFREAFDWTPPLSYEACLERTYGGGDPEPRLAR